MTFRHAKGLLLSGVVAVVGATLTLSGAAPAAERPPIEQEKPAPADLNKLKTALDGQDWDAALAQLGSKVVREDSRREQVALTSDWKFHQGSLPEDASTVAFDDSQWEKIALPHTWNARDGQDGGGYYRGDGWYRLRFPVSSAWVRRQIYLEFDGANRTAEVFLNGSRLGEHRGGFARFRFDATPLINFDGDNVLAVRVNNGEDDNVAPISGDFTQFGGLYRGVSLLVTDRVQIETLDHASPGVFVRSLKVTPAAAELEVRVKLANRESGTRDVEVRVTILDATGTAAAAVRAVEPLAAKSRGEVSQRVSLVRPHLWDGLRDPYLYQVRTEVLVDGTVRDALDQPLGVRFFSVDPDQGFSLNGRPMELRGVNRHQDRDGMGWAIGEAQELEDMALILEMGCNAVRTSHYQQSPLWYDLANGKGVIVWTEIPFVNDVVDTPEFFDNCREQLRELIRQNYNQPSILFWGIGNETFVRDKALTAADTNDRLLRELAAVVREEDSTRLSTYASNGDVTEKRATFTDVVGFNHYFGWYHDAPEDFFPWLDQQHTLRPDLKIAMSEYGAGANPNQHEEPARNPIPDGPWHPEEWQAHFHEVYWQGLAQRPWVWAKFIWCMFDVASDGRDEGGLPGHNDKGLVTLDRKTKKDAFFWYKANWSNAPVLYITSRRFTPRTQAGTTVKIYSNASTVELSVNGETRGKQTSGNHIFLWPGIVLAKGENRITAQAERNGQTLTDECTWTYVPAAE